MSWVAIGASAVGAVGSYASASKASGGSSLPKYLERPSHAIASQINALVGQNKPYTPYGGQRFAPISALEQQGIDLMGQHSDDYRPWLTKAGSALDNANQNFTDIDINKYMNPFIEGALAPAARHISETGYQTLQGHKDQRVSRGAFGGSRQTQLEGQDQKNTMQQLSDLYGTGYATAFDKATGLWQSDRANQQQQAGNYLRLGQGQQQLDQQQFENLLKAGGLQRSLSQQELDYLYQQFQDEQNYPTQHLSELAGVLSQLQGGQATPHGSAAAQGIGTGLGLFGQLYPALNKDKPAAAPVSGGGGWTPTGNPAGDALINDPRFK